MNKERNICIVGLGLLGGSYAMGLTDAGYTVTAVDVRPEAIRYALEKGIIAAGAVEDFAPLLAGADAVVLGLYPHALVDWLRNNQKHLKPGALLTDVCGVKSGVVCLLYTSPSPRIARSSNPLISSSCPRKKTRPGALPLRAAWPRRWALPTSRSSPAPSTIK